MNSGFTSIANINKTNATGIQTSNCFVSNPIEGKAVPNLSILSKPVSEAMRATVLGGISYSMVSRLQKLQQAFQDVFMNKDLSLGEAKVMADRYRALNKIQDKNDYIKAVFEEAKRNFGFDSSSIELSIRPAKDCNGFYGAADNAFSNIIIRDDIPRSHVINTIHHEFRHHLQKLIAYKYSPEKYMEAVNQNIEKISNGAGRQWSDVEKFQSWLDSNLNSSDVAYMDDDFAKKVIYSMLSNQGLNTEEPEKYWDNFNEKDARNAGALIEHVLRTC